MVRFKNRYLLCQLIQSYADECFTQKQIVNFLRDEVLLNFGELGLAKIYFSFQLKYWNPKTRILILRVPRDHQNILTTSLMLLRNFGGSTVKIKVLHSSGTIKRIERKSIELLKRWVMSRVSDKTELNKEEIEKEYSELASKLKKIES